MVLHYTNIRFIEARMAEHDCVASCDRADVGSDVVFRIERTQGRPSLNLFCSDAYEFGLAEYLGRPPLIRKGDIILLKPASKCTEDARKRSGSDRVLIADFRTLMGALNWSDVFKYEPKPK